MKTIKLRRLFRLPIIMKLMVFVATALCLGFFMSGVADLIVIGVIFVIVMIVGLGFFYSYGIKITPKRVTVINQRMFKIFDYERVSYIKIVFGKQSIWGEIKVYHQKPCEFSFDIVDFSSRTLIGYMLWISEVRLTKKFVDKSIARLSQCEKVQIQNCWEEEPPNDHQRNLHNNQTPP